MKPADAECDHIVPLQPPSGGCVLKPDIGGNLQNGAKPAAFRRLCVETSLAKSVKLKTNPAAFRRLCVETIQCPDKLKSDLASRLQAAVC